MSSHLKPISDKEKDYAKSIFPSSGYYKQNGEVWCHCCGNIEYQIPGILEVDFARVNGERMETVEVSLKIFQVIQSRAVCNHTSAYHNRIIELVNRNMGLIRRAAS